MKIIVLLYSILTFINVKIVICHKCGANKLKIKLKHVNATSKINKNLIGKFNSNSYTPIKIGFDFTTLEKPTNMKTSTLSNVKSILKETREEFSKFLKINHHDIDLSKYKEDLKNACGLNLIGEDYSNFLIQNDLIIFPMFYDFGPEILAAASPCIIDTETRRPIVGIIYINNKLNFEITNSKIYMKKLLLHEITHILIFHPEIFKYLGMSKMVGNNSYIISPKVIEKAKQHFGCSKLTELALENDGGEGSIGGHWESRYMLGDYMISTDYPDTSISDITLALFEDSGLYKVNYYSGGLFKFGKNKGCDFFDKKCIEKEKAIFDEFCDVKDRPKCSSSRTIKSSCFLYDYDYELPKKYQYFSNSNKGGFIPANYCPVALELSNPNDYFPNHCQFGISLLAEEYGEKIGENSFCFISSLLPDNSKKDNSPVSICYEVECDTKNTNIIVKIGSKRVICPSNGGSQTLDGFKGSIECPKYNDICSFNDNIMCNEMFNCLKVLSKNDFDELSYYDYEGNAIYLDEYSYYFDDFDPFIPNESLSVSTNLALFFLVYLILFIN